MFYIIQSGTVNVYIDLGGGREAFVEALGPAQFFGEMAFLHGGRRAAHVRASLEEPLQVFALGPDDFRAMLADSEETARALQELAAERSETLASAE